MGEKSSGWFKSGTYANEVCEQYYKNLKKNGEDDIQRKVLAQLCKEYRYCTADEIAKFGDQCAPGYDLKRSSYLDNYTPVERPQPPAKSVLFLCDATGSMQTKMGNNKARYEVA